MNWYSFLVSVIASPMGWLFVIANLAAFCYAGYKSTTLQRRASSYGVFSYVPEDDIELMFISQCNRRSYWILQCGWIAIMLATATCLVLTIGVPMLCVFTPLTVYCP